MIVIFMVCVAWTDHGHCLEADVYRLDSKIWLPVHCIDLVPEEARPDVIYCLKKPTGPRL